MVASRTADADKPYQDEVDKIASQGVACAADAVATCREAKAVPFQAGVAVDAFVVGPAASAAVLAAVDAFVVHDKAKFLEQGLEAALLVLDFQVGHIELRRSYRHYQNLENDLAGPWVSEAPAEKEIVVYCYFQGQKRSERQCFRHFYQTHHSTMG